MFHWNFIMQPKLIITFEQLNEANFLVKTGAINSALTGNPFYPVPWIDQVPSIETINAAYTAYQEAYHAALTRDTLKIVLRDTLRAALTVLLKQLAPYLEVIAQGDLSILVTTGYDLRRDIVHTGSIDPLPAPNGFQVTHGVLTGTLNVQVTRLTGAGSYEVQSTQGDPGIEANWQHVLSSKNASHILLSDLIPGQTYWLRVRAVGNHGDGAWTDPLSIIVL